MALEINGRIYKTAIIHDWFCNMGGGDKVAEYLLDIMPGSPIYTSCYLENSLTEKLKNAKIHTSYLQSKLNQKKDNHQRLLPFMPAAFESFDLNAYDIVVSSSSCCAKGVITNPNTVHICYCHTPMRYGWEFYYEYTAHMNRVKKKAVGYFMNYLRVWDVLAANRVDYFVANSENVARRIWKHYRRESDVICPPYFIQPKTGGRTEDFYLCISRLVPYKRLDLAVRAFNELKLPLIIIGQGSEYEHLKKIAGPGIKILGRQTDEVARDYLSRCKAFIFPGEEDFGCTIVEAQACGKPVIAYGRGGALETILDGQTGLLFPEQTVDSLVDAVKDFQTKDFRTETCINHSGQFSPEIFKEKMKRLIVQKTIEFGDKNHWKVKKTCGRFV